MGGPNKVEEGMPSRISMNVSVGQQSQGSTFGERLNAGLQQAGSVVANGASLVGGVVPGAGIISAAVSSVTNLSTVMPGAASASASYAATGVMPLSSGGMSTTVGATGGTVMGGTTTGPNLTAGSAHNNVGMMNNEISNITAENSKLLQTQIALQRENQVFTSVSNVLKTKHDTVKNSISNIR